MSILLFRPIVVVYQHYRLVLRPYETSEDRDFLLGAFDYKECIQIRELDCSKIEARLTISLPSSVDVLIDRNLVEQDGTLSRRPNPELASWNTPISAGDWVEFRTRVDDGCQGHVSPDVSSPYLFRSEDQVWVMHFTNGTNVEQARFADLKGFHYISQLLACPNRPRECLDLDPRTVSLDDNEPSFQETLDDQARSQLQKRIRELEDSIEIASATGNEGGIADIQQELDELEKERSRSLNWKGQARRLGSTPESEKAYYRVKRNLRTAIEKIAVKMPHFSQFLETSIQLNGTMYEYRPGVSIEWEL